MKTRTSSPTPISRRSGAAIDRLVAVKKEDDLAAINQAIEDLQRASQAMSEHLYAANAAGRWRTRRPVPLPVVGATANGGAEEKPDDVIDAEFEEKK